MMCEISELQFRTRQHPKEWELILASGIITGDGRGIEVPDVVLADISKRCPLTGLRGMGDVIHVALRPVANAMGLQNCDGCADRREFLNQVLPL